MTDRGFEPIDGPAADWDGGIELRAYDPRWAEQFEAEAGRIRRVLGSAALAIEHVGSTAVPGLAAKPIIDIVLTAANAAAEASYAPALTASGYVLRVREPEWREHRMFAGREPAVHLHVFSDGCPEIARMTLFRDWLRRDAADRLLYEQTKRELAGRDWPSMQDYADAKTEVVAQIMERALRWSAAQSTAP